MGNSDLLLPIFNKMDPSVDKMVWCDKGWWPIILELNSKLEAIDPSYYIYQIKEKFGRLSYYFTPSSPHFSKEMHGVIEHYAEIASKTCEITGQPGVLMRRDQPFGTFKTLSMEYAGNGWTPVEKS